MEINCRDLKLKVGHWYICKYIYPSIASDTAYDVFKGLLIDINGDKVTFEDTDGYGESIYENGKVYDRLKTSPVYYDEERDKTIFENGLVILGTAKTKAEAEAIRNMCIFASVTTSQNYRLAPKITQGGTLRYFAAEQVPDCCGATVISDFAHNVKGGTGKITSEEREILEEITKMRTHNIVYLRRDSQKAQIDALIYFGFREIDSFVNKNTGHEIVVLSYKS